jgi:hypothetical protein
MSMLDTELVQIKQKADYTLLAIAYSSYLNTLNGCEDSGKAGRKALLFRYALSTYDIGDPGNPLTEHQVRSIYTRLYELDPTVPPALTPVASIPVNTELFNSDNELRYAGIINLLETYNLS